MKTIVKKILHYLSQRDFGEITFALTLSLIIVSIIMLYGCSKGSSVIGPEPTPPPTPTPTPVFVTYNGTGLNPVGICSDSLGNVWTANVGDNSVTKITQSGQIVTYTGTGKDPENIVYDGSNVWTCNAMGNSVTKITQNGQMVTYTGTGEEPVGIVYDGHSIWTCNLFDNSVTKITQNGQMVTYKIPSEMGKGPMNITFNGVNIWTLNNDFSVTKISLNGEIMAKFNLLPSGHDGITSCDTNVWVENPGANSVTKISPNGEMTNYDLGHTYITPLGLTYDKVTKCIFTINSSTWETGGNSSITRVDQNGIVTTWIIPLQNDHYAICSDKFGNLWVAESDKPGNSVMKVTLPK
jgi:streptogramin lyase